MQDIVCCGSTAHNTYVPASVSAWVGINHACQIILYCNDGIIWQCTRAIFPRAKVGPPSLGRSLKGKTKEYVVIGSVYPRLKPLGSHLDPQRSLVEQFNLLRVVDKERSPAFSSVEWGQNWHI
ncbi:MAG: hypothetical protein JW384_01685 [Nitrosomonadaceae bacterium]|nr:hypothetical protein [Nitrosomonadaceae bacterium]